MPSGGDVDDGNGHEVDLGKTDRRIHQHLSQVAPNPGRSGLASLIGRDKGNPYEAGLLVVLTVCSQVEGCMAWPSSYSESGEI